VRYLASAHPEVGKDINEKKQITPENEKKLREALGAFQAAWQ
jgi:F-type H+-transporting ATPase subunit alpha